MHYFELLHIPLAFEIDLAELEQAYFAAQRQYHPDRFVGKPDAERNQAMQRSVDINNAYHTLKAPLDRARYLLKQHNILVGTDKDTIKPSQELLMEVMEWREEGGIEPNAQESSVQRIATYYAQQDWQAMAAETLRLGYIEKTQEEMRTKAVAL